MLHLKLAMKVFMKSFATVGRYGAQSYCKLNTWKKSLRVSEIKDIPG